LIGLVYHLIHAIRLLEQHPEKISWQHLSKNRAAIHLLEQGLDKISWQHLSKNPAAIHLLEQHPDKIHYDWMSSNPAAMHLLKQHSLQEWRGLSRNPSIFEPDFQSMKRKQCAVFQEELLQRVLHPSRIANLLASGINIEMLDNYL